MDHMARLNFNITDPKFGQLCPASSYVMFSSAGSLIFGFHVGGWNVHKGQRATEKEGVVSTFLLIDERSSVMSNHSKITPVQSYV